MTARGSRTAQTVLAAFLLMTVLVGMATANPSDAIAKKAAPGVIDLRGVNASVFSDWEFHNPFQPGGHYNSSLEYVLQENPTGIPRSLQNWYAAAPTFPDSIYNLTGGN
jgi:hypothetical protein